MTQEKFISDELKVNIVNYLNGNWAECNSSVLQEWLDEKEDNRSLFLQLVSVWEADKILRKEKDFNVDNAWIQLEEKLNSEARDSKTIHLHLRAILKYAAILILVLLIGKLSHNYLNSSSEPQLIATNTIEYTVPYGSKTNLKLPDNSEINLNAGTTIRYNQEFGIKNREIELSGEAFFSVAHNKNLPFIVKVKSISIKALGTKFNVKAYPEEHTVSAILLEGSIKIEKTDSSSNKSLVLKPNQKFSFDKTVNDFTVSTINNTNEISWTSDKWVIKNIKFYELAKLLERRYNVVVNFDDSRIRNYEFGGTVKDETVEQVLSALSYSAPIKYKINKKQVTLFIDESKVDQYKKLLK